MDKLHLILEALGAFTALCTVLGKLVPGKVGAALAELGSEGGKALASMKEPKP